MSSVGNSFITVFIHTPAAIGNLNLDKITGVHQQNSHLTECRLPMENCSTLSILTESLGLKNEDIIIIVNGKITMEEELHQGDVVKIFPLLSGG